MMPTSLQASIQEDDNIAVSSLKCTKTVQEYNDAPKRFAVNGILFQIALLRFSYGKVVTVADAHIDNKLRHPDPALFEKIGLCEHFECQTAQLIMSRNDLIMFKWCSPLTRSNSTVSTGIALPYLPASFGPDPRILLY